MNKKKNSETVFAAGYNIYKLIWIFLIAALLGDLIETIFCRFSMGRFMSRSSVIYGPFSVVWGIGAVLLTILLHSLAHKNDRYIFIFGTLLGAAYEYLCSLFTEIFFGASFWDYSDIPFNLAGRINLLYCFFWGIIALFWVKEVYPLLSRLIEKIPVAFGVTLTWIVVVLMALNMLISGAALVRYSQRKEQIPPGNAVEAFIDSHYGDRVIERVYPSMTSK